MDTTNKFGLLAMLEQRNPVTLTIFTFLVIMSLASWFIMFSKWFDQRKILREADTLDKRFWTTSSLREGASKLDKDSAFRQIADDGLRAADHHDGRLTDKIDRNEWLAQSLNRSTTAVNSKLTGGLAVLASVGSTAPFVGLLGTVVGIYSALIGLSTGGQASIDKVAGPVGEALIMTAIGLFVAVPAVLGYNVLIRRNKNIQERVYNFASDVQGFLVGGARMAPSSTASSLPNLQATAVKGATISHG